MAIEINDAWKVNLNGTLRVNPSYNITALNANFTSLNEDKRHGIYNNVPLEMWWAHYDWGETTPQSTIDYCRSVVSRTDEMFDHSYCWAGLGYESFISRAQYICYYNLVNGKGDEPIIYQDNSTNTPWTFDYNTHEQRSNYQYPNGANWNYGSYRQNKGQYGYQECWKNNTNTSNPNNSTQYWGSSSAYAFVNWTPIHIIAPKNWINLIVVIAKKSLTSLDYVNNVGAWDLYTYTKTNVHETYPYVIGVFIVPYMEYSGSSVPSGKRSPLSTGDSGYREIMFRLSNYIKPAVAGQYIFTSNDDVKNFFHESPWHSGIISRSPMQGSFASWSGIFAGALRYLRDTEPTTNPMSTLCAIQIGGSIHPSSTSLELNENGIYSYGNTLYLTVELGNSKWHREFGEYTYTVGGTTYTDVKGVCYYREFDDTFYEECMQQAACFGLLFTDRHSIAYEGNLYNQNMFLGVLDDNNIGHGEYTHGYANMLEKQMDWDNTTDSDYDPTYRPEPDYPSHYSGVITKIPCGSIHQGGHWYIVSTPEFMSLMDAISDMSRDGYTIYGMEPIKCIVSASLIFMPNGWGVNTLEQPQYIKLGTVDMEDVPQVTEIESSYPETFKSESILIKESFNDFRDYEPYTQINIWLPFAGNIELPTNVFMNRNISYEETVDPLDGSIKYVIYADDIPYCSVSGNCSLDMDISGEMMTLFKTQRLNAQMQAINMAVGALQSMAGGAIGGSIATKLNNPEGATFQYLNAGIGFTGHFVNTATSMYIFDHTSPQPIQIQKATSNVEIGNLFLPCVSITTPRTVEHYDQESFKKIKGFKTFVIDRVGNQKYRIMCENPLISGIICTAEERDMIRKLLVNGIYIKD